MSKAAIIACGALAFISLCIACSTCHGPEIQQALSPITGDPSMGAKWLNNKLVVHGTVESENAKATLMNAAKKTHGSANVVDNMTVSTDVGKAQWLPSALGLFDLLKKMKAGSFSIHKGTLTVKGVVKDSSVASSLLAAAGAMNPMLQVIDEVEIEAVAVQKNINKYLEGKTIEFNTSSAVLLPAGHVMLDTVAMLLKESPDVNVEVGGHTDNRGKEALNLLLSQQRANATVQYLVSKGVSVNRLSAFGYGSEHPIAVNDTEEGRYRNRRIQFTVK
jgi:OOP family OmpA-OmpF porin